jgi:hypothetical protein
MLNELATRAAPFGMVGIKELIKYFESGATGEIVTTQTTYLDLACSCQPHSELPEKYRVHYRGKREFSVETGVFSTLQLFENHPLLIQYTEPMVAVQLVSSVPDKQLFRENVEIAIDRVFGRWRSIEEYQFMPLNTFLEESYGIFVEAPKSLAEALWQAGERSGVKLTMLERHKPKDIFPRVLLLDSWYVIADDFRIEPVM